MKLLSRLPRPPQAGRIVVDGIPLTELEPGSWQRQVSVVDQDFTRYPLMARENVRLRRRRRTSTTRPGSSPRRATRRAGVRQALPLGWDTVLSRDYTGGADLSGGQWQRVALARALFAIRHGARVLVLDEPTAWLDVRAEAEFFDRFLAITAGATTIDHLAPLLDGAPGRADLRARRRAVWSRGPTRRSWRAAAATPRCSSPRPPASPRPRRHSDAAVAPPGRPSPGHPVLLRLLRGPGRHDPRGRARGGVGRRLGQLHRRVQGGHRLHRRRARPRCRRRDAGRRGALQRLLDARRGVRPRRLLRRQPLLRLPVVARRPAHDDDPRPRALRAPRLPQAARPAPAQPQQLVERADPEPARPSSARAHGDRRRAAGRPSTRSSPSCR